VRTAIANNACKFHKDRLNDGVTINFIVAKPRGSGETWSRFLQQVHSARAVMPHTYSQSTYVVQRVYGQPKSKNGNIFQELQL